MSGRINKQELDYYLKGVDKLKGLVDCLINGGYVTDYCKENGLNIKYVRKTLMDLGQLFYLEDDYNNIGHLNSNYLLSGTERIYNEVFDCNPETTEVTKYMPTDATETIIDMLDNPLKYNLFEREVNIAYMSYFDGMTLEEIGHEFNVTRERIRQVLAKFIRKMRSPVRKQMLMMGKDYLKMVEDEYEYQRKEILDRLVAEKLEKDEAIQKLEAELGVYKYHEDVPIEDLELSVRSYNCLKRANYHTLNDLLKLSYEDYPKIRNLGRKSAEEIILKVREYYPKYLKVGVEDES